MSLFSFSPPEKFNLNLHWITVFSLVYLAIPCMLFFSSWFTPWIAWPVNMGIIFSLFTFAMLVYKDERIKQAGYSGSPEVQDVWGGHLNHEHVSLYQKIPDCRSPYIPASILQKGEAENIWPGCILPKARGCDYSRPMKPDGKYVSY